MTAIISNVLTDRNARIEAPKLAQYPILRIFQHACDQHIFSFST